MLRRATINLSFMHHTSRVLAKAAKLTTEIKRIMSNMSDPSKAKGRFLKVQCQLCCTPLRYRCRPRENFVQAQTKGSLEEKLFKDLYSFVQICRAYRTISIETVLVIASLLPIHLKAEMWNAKFRFETKVIYDERVMKI